MTDRPKIRPCSSCQRSTRPPRALIKDYPGTVNRRRGDQCDRCYNSSAPEEYRPSVEHTIAGLNSFLARRRERVGVTK